VSIDYRVAPEDPFPAAVEDSYAGLAWTALHAGDLGIDSARLVLVGSSAGGGIAAGTHFWVATAAAQQSHQVLICPMLDDREITVSSQFEGVIWDRTSNRHGWAALLGEQPGGPDVSGYAAPARATVLSGLPPAYLDCGSSEVFRDEVIDYAARPGPARPGPARLGSGWGADRAAHRGGCHALLGIHGTGRCRQPGRDRRARELPAAGVAVTRLLSWLFGRLTHDRLSWPRRCHDIRSGARRAVARPAGPARCCSIPTYPLWLEGGYVKPGIDCPAVVPRRTT
jgi:acetyl esterase/lipase